jgi:hypothetical protein
LAWLFEKRFYKNRVHKAKYHVKKSCKRAKYHIGMSQEVIYNKGFKSQPSVWVWGGVVGLPYPLTPWYQKFPLTCSNSLWAQKLCKSHTMVLRKKNCFAFHRLI